LSFPSMTAPGELRVPNGSTRQTGGAVTVRRSSDPPGPPYPGHLRTRAPPLVGGQGVSSCWASCTSSSRSSFEVRVTCSPALGLTYWRANKFVEQLITIDILRPLAPFATRRRHPVTHPGRSSQLGAGARGGSHWRSRCDVTVTPLLPDGAIGRVRHAQAATARADAELRAAAEEIREATRSLLQMGISQQDVAAILGVSRQRVSQLLKA